MNQHAAHLFIHLVDYAVAQGAVQLLLLRLVEYLVPDLALQHGRLEPELRLQILVIALLLHEVLLYSLYPLLCLVLLRRELVDFPVEVALRVELQFPNLLNLLLQIQIILKQLLLLVLLRLDLLFHFTLLLQQPRYLDCLDDIKAHLLLPYLYQQAVFLVRYLRNHLLFQEALRAFL